MKILEAQNATLSNYEVYSHLKAMRKDYQSQKPKRRGPGNLETLMKEVRHARPSRNWPL